MLDHATVPFGSYGCPARTLGLGGTISYFALLEDLVLDSAGNGSFTSQAGSVSFEGLGHSGKIVVSYSTDSPASGSVSVDSPA